MNLMDLKVGSLCGLALVSAVGYASPISGTFTGIVTSASDPGQASFGRDPAAWVGKPVSGTFSVDLSTPGIGDANPDAGAFTFSPVPGPGPFVEFVSVAVEIDGQSFIGQTTGLGTVLFGDVVGLDPIRFAPQDSGVSFLGRTVLGFDSFWSPGGVAFNGTNLSLDPAKFFWGFGIVEDLRPGSPGRAGLIRFDVTSVAVVPVPAAAWLLGSALGLMGWLRRQAA
jgi:hypothetical protein